MQLSKDSDIRTQLERVAMKKKELTQKHLDIEYDASTLSKAGQRALNAIRAERLRSSEAEMRLHREENKVAREEVRSQTLEAAIADAKAMRDEAVARLHEKDKEVEELETQSRRNQIAIDRKVASILQVRYDEQIAHHQPLCHNYRQHFAFSLSSSSSSSSVSS